MKEEQFLEILKQELVPALGCTEPAAIAYAAAKARAVLGVMPDRACIHVSRNILKNAMGVGIPGTDAVGLEMAAALGLIGGKSEAILEVLKDVTQEDVKQAKIYAAQHMQVALKDTHKKLYIEVILETEKDRAAVIIEDSHTNITKIIHGSKIVYDQNSCEQLPVQECDKSALSMENIYRFVTAVAIEKLAFLHTCISMNWKAAEYGLAGDYGLNVGRSIFENRNTDRPEADAASYAGAVTAAAADARMAGCILPVMTLCGSGNQGITATLPVIAAAKAAGRTEEALYRALALSCLVTIHVKQFIGKLSPLCGCGMGSSIGACCALVYMQGGNLKQINSAVKNMIADVSGIICDGAKAGCSLKIGTVVASAFQCAMLALRDYSAGDLDGIVSADVESTIHNLGILGSRGMADTDQVILDMMVCR